MVRMMDGCTHLTWNKVSIFAGTHRRIEEGEDAGEENRRNTGDNAGGNVGEYHRRSLK